MSRSFAFARKEVEKTDAFAEGPSVRPFFKKRYTIEKDAVKRKLRGSR